MHEAGLGMDSRAAAGSEDSVGLPVVTAEKQGVGHLPVP